MRWLLCGALSMVFGFPNLADAKKSKKNAHSSYGIKKTNKSKAKSKTKKSKKSKKSNKSNKSNKSKKSKKSIKKRVSRKRNQRTKSTHRINRSRRDRRVKGFQPSGRFKVQPATRRSSNHRVLPSPKKVRKTLSRRSKQAHGAMPKRQRRQIGPAKTKSQKGDEPQLHRNTKIRKLLPKKAVFRRPRAKAHPSPRMLPPRGALRPHRALRPFTSKTRQTISTDNSEKRDPESLADSPDADGDPGVVRADRKSPEAVRRQWEETRRRIVDSARGAREAWPGRRTPRRPRSRRVMRHPLTGRIINPVEQPSHSSKRQQNRQVVVDELLPIRTPYVEPLPFSGTEPQGITGLAPKASVTDTPPDDAHPMAALDAPHGDDQWYGGFDLRGSMVWSFYDLLDDSGPPISQATTREDYAIDAINFYRIQGDLKTRYIDARLAYQSNMGLDVSADPSVLFDLMVAFSSVEALAPFSLRYAVLDFDYGSVNLSQRDSGITLETAEFKTHMSTYELGYAFGEHLRLFGHRLAYTVPRNVYLDMAVFPAERIQISEQLLEIDATVYALGARLQSDENRLGLHGVIGFAIGLGSYDIRTLVGHQKLDQGQLSQVEFLGRIGYRVPLGPYVSAGLSLEFKVRSLTPTGLPDGVRNSVSEAGEDPTNMSLSFGKVEMLRTAVCEIMATF